MLTGLTGLMGLATEARPRVALVCLALSGTGCYTTSRPVHPPTNAEREKARSAPIWITDPSQGLEPQDRGKYLAAVGVCAYRGNLSHAMRSAHTHARSELIQVAGAHVASVFRDFAREQIVFTDPKSSRSEQLTESLTQVTASRHLSQAQVVRKYRDDEAKQFYVLMRISKDDLARSVADSVAETLAAMPSAARSEVLKAGSDDTVRAFANAIRGHSDH